jgi:hypothetical protein
MGWLENAIIQRMPVSLGVDQLRETLGEVRDDRADEAEGATTPRTGG